MAFLFSLKIKAWVALAKLNWYGGFTRRVKMVQTPYDLCQSLMFTTTSSAKPGSSFFRPFGYFRVVWPQIWK